MFLPNIKILINDIKINHFVSWTGLTTDLIRKHLPLIIPTEKVNLNQEKQGLRLTKTLINPQNYDTSDEIYPSAPTPNDITHDVVYSVISAYDKAHMDLTGRFPYYTSRLN